MKPHFRYITGSTYKYNCTYTFQAKGDTRCIVSAVNYKDRSSVERPEVGSTELVRMFQSKYKYRKERSNGLACSKFLMF